MYCLPLSLLVLGFAFHLNWIASSANMSAHGAEVMVRRLPYYLQMTGLFYKTMLYLSVDGQLFRQPIKGKAACRCGYAPSLMPVETPTVT